MYVVLFDIDGTLISSGGAGQAAFEQTFDEDFGITEVVHKVSFAGRSDRAIAQELMELHGVEATPMNWQRFSDGYVRRLPASLSASNGSVLPGVHDLLDQLAAMNNVALGLLTGNVQRGAQHKLGYYDLGNRFAFGGFGENALDRNEIARAAAESSQQYLAKLNSDAATNGQTGMMVIGDTPLDVSCARAIGAVAVAVATGGASREELQQSQPDLLLEDLTDSEPLLKIVRSGVAAAADSLPPQNAT